MDLRKCHKCGNAMIPQSRVTYNYLFSSLNYRCLKCQGKIQVPENVTTGMMVAVGLGCIVAGNTLYAALGAFVIVVPFWRRLRNPALSPEAMAALGLAELTPADLEPQRQPARTAQAEQSAPRDWMSRAEQQFTQRPNEQTPAAPVRRSPVQPTARPSGFGRRASR